MAPHPISAEDLNAEQRRLLDLLVSGPRSTFLAAHVRESGEWPLPGPFGPMLLDPAIGDALQKLGVAIRYTGVLPDSLRELAIVATAAACRAAYELDHHLPLARAAGIDDQVLDAVVAGEEAPDPIHMAIVELSRSLTSTGLADAPIVHRLELALGRAATFELVILTGYYRLLATVLSVYQVN